MQKYIPKIAIIVSEEFYDFDLILSCLNEFKRESKIKKIFIISCGEKALYPLTEKYAKWFNDGLTNYRVDWNSINVEHYEPMKLDNDRIVNKFAYKQHYQNIVDITDHLIIWSTYYHPKAFNQLKKMADERKISNKTYFFNPKIQ